MSCFTKRHFLIILICLLTATYSYSQIKVSEFIQESKIASNSEKILFFVDFWATWCGPCHIAKEYLGVLQKQYPNDFYIVSLTQESPVTVERFLSKKPTNLAIAIDHYGETFSAYNVKSLPHGILFNANGKILWEGNSADLKPAIINRYINKYNYKSTINSFFETVTTENTITKDYIPIDPIEVNPISSELKDLNVIDNQNYLKLSGSLKSVVGYLAKIYKNQIQIKNDLNTNFEIYFKKPLDSNSNLAVTLINYLNLSVERSYKSGDGISFTINTPKFWDTQQIDWGNNNSKYLVGDSQIQADNISLRDIAYQLAYVLETPIVVPDESFSYQLHDWDFHYKFFQLMQTDLEDNFGIKAEKKTISYPVYYIQKKTP